MDNDVAARAHLDNTFESNVLNWLHARPWLECSGPNVDYLNHIQYRLSYLRHPRLPSYGEPDFDRHFGNAANSNLRSLAIVIVRRHSGIGNVGFVAGSVLNRGPAVWMETSTKVDVKGLPWVTNTYGLGRILISKFACGFPTGLLQAKATHRVHGTRHNLVWRGCNLGPACSGKKRAVQVVNAHPALFLE